MADLPPAGHAHELRYAQFDSFLPDWFQFYSLLGGTHDAATVCAARRTYRFPRENRRMTIVNCSDASDAEVTRLANNLQSGLNAVEDRFGHDIHVSKAVFELFNLGVRHESRQTALVRPKHLTFRIAVVYDASAPDHSARDIVRVTAHELFHIARHVTRRDKTSTLSSSLSEETRASLFESCIDQDVYGSIEKSAFDKDMQFDPNWVKNVPSVYVSAAGGMHAYEILSDAVGKDHRLSSAAEWSRFNRLCRKVVH